jgi:hypothetical protein
MVVQVARPCARKRKRKEQVQEEKDKNETNLLARL